MFRAGPQRVQFSLQNLLLFIVAASILLAAGVGTRSESGIVVIGFVLCFIPSVVFLLFAVAGMLLLVFRCLQFLIGQIKGVRTHCSSDGDLLTYRNTQTTES